MKTIFKYKKVTKHHYHVLTQTDKIIGEFTEEVDGLFYLFLYKYNGGAISEEMLLELSNELSKLNKSWNDKTNKYFNEEKL